MQLILSKMEIIKMQLLGYNFNDKVVKKVISKQLQIPDNEFIELCNNELHWKLEPIRKNLYIING